VTLFIYFEIMARLRSRNRNNYHWNSHNR